MNVFGTGWWQEVTPINPLTLAGSKHHSWNELPTTDLALCANIFFYPALGLLGLAVHNTPPFYVYPGSATGWFMETDATVQADHQVATGKPSLMLATKAWARAQSSSFSWAQVLEQLKYLEQP